MNGCPSTHGRLTRYGSASRNVAPGHTRSMPRACLGSRASFCVLASKSALVRAAQLDPQGAQKRADMEIRMGHTFKKGMSMAQIIALAAEAESVKVENWAA